MSLIELQRAFQGYILDGQPQVEDRVDGRNADLRRRLRIYYDAYRLRLAEVLASDYEALRALMGAEDFGNATRTYVERTPSTHRNVRWYGQGLAGFLERTAPWSRRPELHELARFEWTITLAFDAEDADAVLFEELSLLPPGAWPALGLVLHPSLRIIDLSSNAPALRKAADAGEALPAIGFSETPIPWLVWRKDLTVCFRSLGDPERWALQAMSEGANFTALCEGLCTWLSPDAAAPHAAQLLRRWVDDALIADLAT